MQKKDEKKDAKKGGKWIHKSRQTPEKLKKSWNFVLFSEQILLKRNIAEQTKYKRSHTYTTTP